MPARSPRMFPLSLASMFALGSKGSVRSDAISAHIFWKPSQLRMQSLPGRNARNTTRPQPTGFQTIIGTSPSFRMAVPPMISDSHRVRSPQRSIRPP